MAENYFIKDGYRINWPGRQFHDSEEDALTYQIDTYKCVRKWAQDMGAGSLMDIGCGYGLKLAQFLRPLDIDIMGIDDEHAINYCHANHSFGVWHIDDIEDPRLKPDKTFDMVLSADVIEHLKDPDALLDYIYYWSHSNTYVVLSTPERDLRRGTDSIGPPGNPAHIREWNYSEFAAYLEDRGLRIMEHRIVDLCEGMRTCQTVLAQFV